MGTIGAAVLAAGTCRVQSSPGGARRSSFSPAISPRGGVESFEETVASFTLLARPSNRDYSCGKRKIGRVSFTQNPPPGGWWRALKKQLRVLLCWRGLRIEIIHAENVKSGEFL